MPSNSLAEIYGQESIPVEVECQTDLQQEWKTVEELQQRICLLEVSLCASAQLDVKILASNDKLTRLYTGLPTYDAFMALVEYLEPKARDMIA